MTKGKTRLIGRSSVTGKFMPVKKAREQKRTSEVERIRVPRRRGKSS